jgi:hypothetical protein
MLLWRIFIPLGLKHLQRINDSFARVSGLDHGIHVAAFSGNVGVGKTCAKFVDLFIPRLGQDLCPLGFCLSHLGHGVQLAFVNNVHCAFRAHHGDFRRRPGVVHVRTDVLG